jgi:hypothetical protein
MSSLEKSSSRAPFIELWNPFDRGLGISFDCPRLNAKAGAEIVLIPDSDSFERFHALLQLILVSVAVNEASGMREKRSRSLMYCLSRYRRQNPYTPVLPVMTPPA